jgi:hypothetical protein
MKAMKFVLNPFSHPYNFLSSFGWLYSYPAGYLHVSFIRCRGVPLSFVIPPLMFGPGVRTKVCGALIVFLTSGSTRTVPHEKSLPREQNDILQKCNGTQKYIGPDEDGEVSSESGLRASATLFALRNL